MAREERYVTGYLLALTCPHCAARLRHTSATAQRDWAKATARCERCDVDYTINVTLRAVTKTPATTPRRVYA